MTHYTIVDMFLCNEVKCSTFVEFRRIIYKLLYFSKVIFRINQNGLQQTNFGIWRQSSCLTCLFFKKKNDCDIVIGICAVIMCLQAKT